MPRDELMEEEKSSRTYIEWQLAKESQREITSQLCEIDNLAIVGHVIERTEEDRQIARDSGACDKGECFGRSEDLTGLSLDPPWIPDSIHESCTCEG